MTFNPLNILGETRVEVPFNFTCTLVLENETTATEEIKEEIENIDINYDVNYIEYNISDNVISFFGEIPLDVFDRYKFKYVDKGSSDKIMTPIVTNMSGVPDRKDLFEVTPDSRQSVLAPLDFIEIDVLIKRTTKILDTDNTGEAEGSGTQVPNGNNNQNNEIITYIDYNHKYQITATQDMDKLKNWMKDYFENRYN